MLLGTDKERQKDQDTEALIQTQGHRQQYKGTPADTHTDDISHGASPYLGLSSVRPIYLQPYIQR